MDLGTDAQRLVWGAAIPLQIHLDGSEITTLTPPPLFLVMGPRLGYLPLLIPLLKPHFNSSLPPGVDTIWFDYKGLPLKWYIPIGVLFDLLCAEPERPWNLTVHFRGYPTETLTPCDGEDCLKWSFINSLKEAAYIINGNCKNIMNMSQSDQLELWKCVGKANMGGYCRVSSKLKLGTAMEECIARIESSSMQPNQGSDADIIGPSRTGRIPVRLYVRNVEEDLDDLTDATPVNSWELISYLNQPIEICNNEGMYLTLHDALKALLPQVFMDESLIVEQISNMLLEDVPQLTESDSQGGVLEKLNSTGKNSMTAIPDRHSLHCSSSKTRVKLIRIHGIEPRLDLPLSWVISNLLNPEFYLHVCVYLAVSPSQTDRR
ncbi:autophagy protein 5-like isoform X2 [Aristolochia californica]|uniref:autophagy protein 5-like isoform X2 n=1 Tax=Aristolochia californica TaxID=171875 RepID=UPI0035D61219